MHRVQCVTKIYLRFKMLKSIWKRNSFRRLMSIMIAFILIMSSLENLSFWLRKNSIYHNFMLNHTNLKIWEFLIKTKCNQMMKIHNFHFRLTDYKKSQFQDREVRVTIMKMIILKIKISRTSLVKHSLKYQMHLIVILMGHLKSLDCQVKEVCHGLFLVDKTYLQWVSI